MMLTPQPGLPRCERVPPFAYSIRCARLVMTAVITCLLAGCASRLSQLNHHLEESVPHLSSQLSALSPVVNPEEARQLSRVATEHSIELARRYRIVRPPLLHNALVNLRLKSRGLCHHWTRDLFDELRRHEFVTLEIRWGIARAGTLREHNAIVITAREQEFENGIVLDSWRQSGRLHWCDVSKDSYPWEEGEVSASAE